MVEAVLRHLRQVTQPLLETSKARSTTVVDERTDPGANDFHRLVEEEEEEEDVPAQWPGTGPVFGGQGRPAPTRPPVKRGSKDTTVPVCAAWMIVSAP